MAYKKLPLLAFIILFFSCSKNNSNTNSNTGPSLPAISAFTPLAAPVDSIVTITGVNFNVDPSQDIVEFNGTAAVVKSATETKLVVSVPSGATTGKITVSVANNTATSAGNFTVSAPVSDEWIQKTSFPGKFMTAVSSFAVGDKFYIGMGEDINGWQHDLWQYDALTDVWTQKADYPANPSGAIGFSIGNKGYLAMNIDSGKLPLWQYDTDLNTWTRKAELPFTPRYGALAFGVNGYGYVGLGTYKDLWQYDPVTDTWTQKASYPGAAATYAGSFVIGNYAYIGAGMNGLNTPSGSTEFYQYDPSLDKWIQKADFPGGGRNSPSGFAIGDYGYLGTGYDLNGHYLSDFWQYNPTTNTWKQIKDFGGGIRAATSGFATATKGYLGFGNGSTHQLPNGFSSADYFDFWQYQP